MIWLIYLTAYPASGFRSGAVFFFWAGLSFSVLKRSTLVRRDHIDSADLRSITRRTDLAQELCYARQQP